MKMADDYSLGLAAGCAHSAAPDGLATSRDLPDIQATDDLRGIAIDRAGIEDLKLPARVEDVDGTAVDTVVTFSAAVSVRPNERGTHMSRLVNTFLDLDGRLALAKLPRVYRQARDRCSAYSGHISADFVWFVQKKAPVTKLSSLLDMGASYAVARDANGALSILQRLCVPVTTLCPCSKAISRSGAHNQRADVQIDLQVRAPVAIGALAAMIERHASCEVYGVLKRADEKYVTEKAFNNPRFVEDVVRDVYAECKGLPNVFKARVRVVSHESIHNHQAYALIDDWARRIGDRADQ